MAVEVGLEVGWVMVWREEGGVWRVKESRQVRPQRVNE